MTFKSGESFFDAQPMFVCEQTNLKILEVNNAASRILGYSQRYFLGKKLISLGRLRSAEELGICNSEVVNEEFSRVWQLDTKSGEEKYFQLSAHLINYKGNPAKLVVAHNVTSKITAKSRRKRKLLSTQLKLNNNPLAEIEWDPLH